MAVLASIKPFITKALLNGQVVILQDIGRFQVALHGRCYDATTMSVDEFSPSNYIKGYKINFRPEKELKHDIAAGLQLKRISSEAMK